MHKNQTVQNYAPTDRWTTGRVAWWPQYIMGFALHSQQFSLFIIPSPSSLPHSILRDISVWAENVLCSHQSHPPYTPSQQAGKAPHHPPASLNVRELTLDGVGRSRKHSSATRCAFGLPWQQLGSPCAPPSLPLSRLHSRTSLPSRGG